MAGWTNLSELLQIEIIQRLEEGCALDVVKWQRRVQNIKPNNLTALNELYEELNDIQPPTDLPFQEPSDLQTIHDMRPNGVREMNEEISERDLFDKIHGGWLGCGVGCSLGRPLEIEPFSHDPQRRERHHVQRWLENADAWPLENYIPGQSREEIRTLSVTNLESTREEIKAVEPHPTINQMMVTLRMLEESGLDFTTADLAQTWLRLLPFDHLEYAQAQVYLNLVCQDYFAIANRPAEVLYNLNWQPIALHRNPYREWNGAQRSADLYGYISAGQPELAASRAWADARLSHDKNGLYGPMFIAATLAGAFLENDPLKLIDLGLSEIPRNSRLASSIRQALKFHHDGRTWEEAWDMLRKDTQNYDMHHSIPNLTMVALAVLYGEGDFTKSIALAACSGHDVATNTATTGSILGTMHGKRCLPGSWVTPLYNTVNSTVLGCEHGTISDGARRTVRLLNESPLQAEEA